MSWDLTGVGDLIIWRGVFECVVEISFNITCRSTVYQKDLNEVVIHCYYVMRI